MREQEHYKEVADTFRLSKVSSSGGRQGHEYLFHNIELHQKMIGAIDNNNFIVAEECERDMCIITCSPCC